MSKKTSTKNLVKAWQHVMVGLTAEMPAPLKVMFGDGPGTELWKSLEEETKEQLDKVRRKYAVLTCVQGCFRKLKNSEDRQAAIAGARMAALGLYSPLPDGVWQLMDCFVSSEAAAPAPSSGAAASGEAAGAGAGAVVAT